MHPIVAAITARHLALLDERLPGRALGLYLTGSVGLNDFHPPDSDIDAVVVLGTPVPDPEVLRGIHGEVDAAGDGPAYDVFYLTVRQLAAPAVDGMVAPYVMHGHFDAGDGGAPVSPVLWAELARYAVPVRAVPHLVVRDDHWALRAWTADNLRTYWLPWVMDAESHLAAGRVGEGELDSVVTWPTLGVPRLHALLATDRLISKSEAARYAADRFPEHARLALRVLAHRRGDRQQFTQDDAREAVALARTVIAAAPSP